jgi:hypothetical protein
MSSIVAAVNILLAMADRTRKAKCENGNQLMYKLYLYIIYEHEYVYNNQPESNKIFQIGCHFLLLAQIQALTQTHDVKCNADIYTVLHIQHIHIRTHSHTHTDISHFTQFQLRF